MMEKDKESPIILMAVALIYKSVKNNIVTHRVFSIIVDYQKNDDETDLLAKAERHMDKSRADEIDGFHRVAFELNTTQIMVGDN